MTDDDNAPPIRLPPIPMPDDGPLSRDLAGPESLYSFTQLMQHLERRIDAMGREVGSLLASRDAGRKVLWLVIPALVGALATVLVFAAEKISASSERVGETAAELRSLRDRAASQEADIRELRAALRRQVDADPTKPTSDIPFIPDRYTVLDATRGMPARKTDP